jgi:2-methylcitrate dehydratase PrpD
MKPTTRTCRRSRIPDAASCSLRWRWASTNGARARRYSAPLSSVTTSARVRTSRWAVGSPIQAVLDSLSVLIKEHGIGANDVEKLTVTIHKSGAVTVNDRSMPDINLQHLMSVMLLDGTVTFATAHDGRRMCDPKVLAIKPRIELVGSEELERAPTRHAIVVVKTRDGRELKHHTPAVRGTAANPMTRLEVEEKWYDLMVPVLRARRARALIDTVWRIEKVADIRALRPLLRA